MRRTLVSTLFLSAALLHAQNSTKGQGVSLEARNAAPNSLTAAAPAKPTNDLSTTPGETRISTGVTGAKLVKLRAVQLSTSDFHTQDVAAQKLVLHFQVDENGTPKNIEVLKPVNPEVDARVVNAVRQYRYSPAKLDGQVVTSDLKLVVSFESR